MGKLKVFTAGGSNSGQAGKNEFASINTSFGQQQTKKGHQWLNSHLSRLKALDAPPMTYLFSR
jgi:hypothetical protein